ncbi:MAG: ice-binding family protein [Nanoarchaeota archaeon]|nr:ice-binding family protein [Nanoarchaeota archaeon]
MTNDKGSNFMIATKFKILIFALLFSIAIILSVQFVAAYTSPAPVNLGTAGNFVILSKSGISTTGTTSITGNIGVSPNAASSITGFGLIMHSSNQFAISSLVSGRVFASNYAPPTPINMGIAILDMQNAYTDAASRSSDQTLTGSIGGLTLAPGVYTTASNLIIPTDVTLDCSGDANAVFIFQIGGTLDISSGKKVILINGCQAKNIFWQVAGTTTLGTTSIFNGNILDQTLIAMKNGATLNGRALAQTAVTLIANKVSSPPAASSVLTETILLPPSANLPINSTLQLNITNLDQFGMPIVMNISNISFTSSNLSVATVNVTSGLVTAIAPGSATITATNGTIILTSVITVSNPKTIPVMDDKLFILLTVITLILGLYGLNKYGR